MIEINKEKYSLQDFIINRNDHLTTKKGDLILLMHDLADTIRTPIEVTQTLGQELPQEIIDIANKRFLQIQEIIKLIMEKKDD